MNPEKGRKVYPDSAPGTHLRGRDILHLTNSDQLSGTGLQRSLAMPVYLRFMIIFVVTMALSLSVKAQIKTLLYEGERYVKLEDLAQFYGGEMVPTYDKKVIIKTRWAELSFKPDERQVYVSGSLVWMHEAMKKIRWHWVIREVDALHVIDPVMRPTEYLKKSGYRVVVLDPGHGGPDSGAKGKRGMEEKHAALDIARKVRSHLSAAGLKVYMTRDNDRFIELEERSRMAKRWGADLFVSIHLNSAGNESAIGAETFVLTSAGYASTVGESKSGVLAGNKFDAQNALLGFHLQRSIIKNVKPLDRGLKHARFIVLRNAPCPSALVECGFLSNRDEEKRFSLDAHREEVAQSIVKGILVYVGLAKQAQRTQP